MAVVSPRAKRVSSSIRSGGGIGSAGGNAPINVVEVRKSDGTVTNVVYGSSDYNKIIKEGGMENSQYIQQQNIKNVQTELSKNIKVGIDSAKTQQYSDIRDLQKYSTEEIARRQKIQEQYIARGYGLTQDDIEFSTSKDLTPIRTIPSIKVKKPSDKIKPENIYSFEKIKPELSKVQKQIKEGARDVQYKQNLLTGQSYDPSQFKISNKDIDKYNLSTNKYQSTIQSDYYKKYQLGRQTPKTLSSTSNLISEQKPEYTQPFKAFTKSVSEGFMFKGTAEQRIKLGTKKEIFGYTVGLISGVGSTAIGSGIGKSVAYLGTKFITAGKILDIGTSIISKPVISKNLLKIYGTTKAVQFFQAGTQEGSLGVAREGFTFAKEISFGYGFGKGIKTKFDPKIPKSRPEFLTEYQTYKYQQPTKQLKIVNEPIKDVYEVVPVKSNQGLPIESVTGYKRLDVSTGKYGSVKVQRVPTVSGKESQLQLKPTQFINEQGTLIIEKEAKTISELTKSKIKKELLDVAFRTTPRYKVEEMFDPYKVTSGYSKSEKLFGSRIEADVESFISKEAIARQMARKELIEKYNVPSKFFDSNDPFIKAQTSKQQTKLLEQFTGVERKSNPFDMLRQDIKRQELTLKRKDIRDEDIIILYKKPKKEIGNKDLKNYGFKEPLSPSEVKKLYEQKPIQIQEIKSNIITKEDIVKDLNKPFEVQKVVAPKVVGKRIQKQTPSIVNVNKPKPIYIIKSKSESKQETNRKQNIKLLYNTESKYIQNNKINNMTDIKLKDNFIVKNIKAIKLKPRSDNILKQKIDSNLRPYSTFTTISRIDQPNINERFYSKQTVIRTPEIPIIKLPSIKFGKLSKPKESTKYQAGKIIGKTQYNPTLYAIYTGYKSKSKYKTSNLSGLEIRGI